MSSRYYPTIEMDTRYELQGSKDIISGNENNDGCPSEDRSILYCIGYEIGYNDGYYCNLNTEDNMTRELGRMVHR